MFSAKEENVHRLFGEKRYSVPFYQRPYSWVKENAENLWDDLFSSWREEGISGGGYFLGSVVLVSKKGSSREDVVDGQQRFITLQLLLFALAEGIEDTDNKKKLLRYVISEEDEFAGTKAELVVKPGERYVDAYEKLIASQTLEPGARKTAGIFIDNLDVFRRKTVNLNQQELKEFAKFIVQTAYIAVLRADTEVKALRIFSVLNDRGIDLHPVDILKARLLETTNLSQEQKIRHAGRWEQYEEEFERKRFQDLIGHIRMIYVRGRTKRPLHEDILERVKKAIDADNFLSKELPEYAAAFSEMMITDCISVQNLVEIGKRTQFKDWEAPLLFILRNRENLSNFETVVKRLSSIVAMMAITKATDGQRAGRFGKIIGDIENLIQRKKTINDVTSLSISKLEFSEFKRTLQGDAYSIRGLKAGMLWFEAISGDGDRSVNTGEITIEHLLPRTAGTEEWWLAHFDKRSWSQHANRVGNLVLVTGRSNQKMARNSFDKKKTYLNNKGGSQWVWTQDALQREAWGPAEIINREERIFKKIANAFEFVRE